MRRALIVGLMLPWLAAASASRAAAQSAHLIVITGVSGDEEHAALFDKWGGAVIDKSEKAGLPAANIVSLGERPDPQAKPPRLKSSRENVMKALADTAAGAKAGDDIFILLIGHGSFDGQTASFNLPGPDLSVTEWAKLLEQFADERVVFVNTASSSGAFVEPLKKPGRTIVAATKTGGERNEPRFAQYFVEALENEAADRDRNGRVSISEAFDYAQTKVKAEYEQGGHILTEHAVLEDSAQGKQAASEFITPDKARATIAQIADPELRALLEQQNDLERQVAALRLKKDAMEPAEYDKQLEKLLTDLALKTKAVRDREAAGK